MSSKEKKEKKILTILAPPYFGSREIGETLVLENENAINRTIRTSLYAITDDFSKQYLLLKFRIVRVTDSIAETVFYGHEYGREYLRSLIRRGTTRVDGIFDVETKDKYKLRLTITAFIAGRSRSWKNKRIRNIMKKIVEEKAANMNLDQFAQELVLDKVASDIYNEARKIASIKHLGVIKSKVLKIPEEVYKQPVIKEEIQKNVEEKRIE